VTMTVALCGEPAGHDQAVNGWEQCDKMDMELSQL
jgi:hypothetical protein